MMVAKKKPETKNEAPAKKKPGFGERPKYKYGVQDIIEALDIGGETATQQARARLRKADIELNTGNVYGWDTKAEFDEVVAKLKKTSRSEPESKNTKAAAKAGAERKADKPAAKPAAKKPAAKKAA